MSEFRFDDWSYVDCNDCQHYWNDACSGTEKEKPCKSYIAVKRKDIPMQIKKLEKELKSLKIMVFTLILAILVFMVGMLVFL